MRLHRDHVAGGVFVAAGALVLAASGDLPFGTLASPGAGMMPTVLVVLMMAFGLVLLLRARASPALADIAWKDLPHAARVAALTTVSVAVYEWLGFALTTMLFLLGLIWLVEGRPPVKALAFSLAATGVLYGLFSVLLRTPLPAGPLGF